ncbi:MAG: DUF3489 domain-containing protein [Bdellovibrionales bacterium]
MSKKPSKTGAKTPSKVVKRPAKNLVKTKAQSNGKPTNDAALSVPMQAGLAAVEAMPGTKTPREGSKLAKLVEMLERPEGATIEQIIEATEWKPHTARAAISHTLGKKRGYQIVSERPVKGHSVVTNAPEYGQRIYKIIKD